MENSHLADFIIDKENTVIRVEKMYDASLEKVWDAWTKSELLDQWWAPKPWKAVTKDMDFREGGHWLYCMQGPEGEQIWGKAVYKSINKLVNFEVLDVFSDENGVQNSELPLLYWNTSFKTADKKTVVIIEIRFDTVADVDKIVEMGFKDGFEAALGNLDEFLKR